MGCLPNFSTTASLIADHTRAAPILKDIDHVDLIHKLHRWGVYLSDKRHFDTRSRAPRAARAVDRRMLSKPLVR